MIEFSTLPEGEGMYTYIDDDGSNVHIAAARLREHCLKVQPEIFYTHVTMDLANQFFRDNAVDMARVFALTPKHLEEPIIYCKDGSFTGGRPDVFLVDGHHRYVRAVMERREFIESWVLDLEFWKPFQITGVPDMTKEWLRAMPIKPRRY